MPPSPCITHTTPNQVLSPSTSKRSYASSVPNVLVAATLLKSSQAFSPNVTGRVRETVYDPGSRGRGAPSPLCLSQAPHLSLCICTCHLYLHMGHGSCHMCKLQVWRGELGTLCVQSGVCSPTHLAPDLEKKQSLVYVN